jgi:predicted metallopeptidase
MTFDVFTHKKRLDQVIAIITIVVTDVTQRMSYTEKSKVVIPECLHRVSSSSGFPLKTCGNDSPFCFLRNIS